MVLFWKQVHLQKEGTAEDGLVLCVCCDACAEGLWSGDGEEMGGAGGGTDMRWRGLPGRRGEGGQETFAPLWRVCAGDAVSSGVGGGREC